MGMAYDFVEELIYSQSAILEVSSLNYTQAYSKSGTIITDVDEVEHITVILYFHYDVLQDLKLTIDLVSNGTETTYNQTKEFSVSSTEQAKTLSERLTTLEERVNKLVSEGAIILE